MLKYALVSSLPASIIHSVTSAYYDAQKLCCCVGNKGFFMFLKCIAFSQRGLCSVREVWKHVILHNGARAHTRTHTCVGYSIFLKKYDTFCLKLIRIYIIPTNSTISKTNYVIGYSRLQELKFFLLSFFSCK